MMHFMKISFFSQFIPCSSLKINIKFIIIPNLYKFELLLQLFKNCGNYLKIATILLCFYYILINNCRNFLNKNSYLRELGVLN